jgi:hypothetical protein
MPTSHRDDGVGDALVAQGRHGAVDAVSLGDPAEVEMDVGIVEPHLRAVPLPRNVHLPPESA